jgi:hypothetical protein
MLQSSLSDGVAFDPFSFQKDGAQAIEHNADLLFSRMVLRGCPLDVADKRLVRRRGRVGFLSCISTTSRQGYDAGRGGERDIEYREQKPYWRKRLKGTT